MKKIYYVRTNANDFLLTDDGETRRILDNENALCPRDEDGQYIDINGFIAAVEDDSSWDEYSETVEELTDGCEIIAVADANC